MIDDADVRSAPLLTCASTTIDMSASQSRIPLRPAGESLLPFGRSALTPVAATDPGLAHVDPLAGTSDPLLRAPFEQRYSKPRLLGRGGMGEVFLLRDGRVGRDVALKRMRAPRSARVDLEFRFLREARVQGQLEHPSIVPVYDMGVTPDGDAYFTMKRVQGLSLAQIVTGLRQHDPVILQQYSPRRVLGAISRAALALAYAHTRGVIHRDLKPANIMLGDYGEVYLLDWGVAKIGAYHIGPLLASTEGAAATLRGSGTSQHTQAEYTTLDAAGLDEQTGIGSLLGTPGYIAPEQARGAQIDIRADIYSMGCILFEVLALEPLHRGTDPEDLLQSTFLGTDCQPSERAPGLSISVELDEICQRATAQDPADRFATARELSEAIERYLHGARDEEQRAQMSQHHMIRAQLQLAHATLDSSRAEFMRVDAIRELGRALALNPDNQAASDTLMRALSAAPGKLTAKAEAELAAAGNRDHARGATVRGMAYLSWLLVVQLGPFVGVSNIPAWLGLSSLLSVLTIYNFWMASSRRSNRSHAVVMMVLSFASVAMMAGLFGPFVLVPALSIATATSLIVSLRASRGLRWLIMALSVLAVLVPVALKALDVWSVSGVFGDTERALPAVGQLTAGQSLLLAASASVMILVFANVLVGRAVDSLVNAERKGYGRAWRLRQLLPKRSWPH